MEKGVPPSLDKCFKKKLQAPSITEFWIQYWRCAKMLVIHIYESKGLLSPNG